MLDFSKLAGATTVEQPKSNKKVKIKRQGEPGIKVPINNYKQVGQFCDRCEDVVMHLLDMDRRTKICADCGLLTYFGVKSTDKLKKIVFIKAEEQFYTLLNLYV